MHKLCLNMPSVVQSCQEEDTVMGLSYILRHHAVWLQLLEQSFESASAVQSAVLQCLSKSKRYPH